MNTPFRVMCVDTCDYSITKDSNVKSPVIVGSEYVVIGVINRFGYNCYLLAELPNTMAFDAECFAILPEQSADEINEAAKEAIVPAPAIPATV